MIRRKKNNLLYGDNCHLFVCVTASGRVLTLAMLLSPLDSTFLGIFGPLPLQLFLLCDSASFPLCRASFPSESFLFLAFVRPSSTKLVLLVFSLFLAFRRARPNKEFASTAETVFYSHFFLLVVLAVLNIFVVVIALI